MLLFSVTIMKYYLLRFLFIAGESDAFICAAIPLDPSVISTNNSLPNYRARVF